MEEKQNTSKTQIYNLVILDKSGSMRSIANAAISGFNETVGGIRSAQERYKDTQEHFVSLFTFCDCAKNYVYENIPVAEIKELTSNEYRPCCCTPLYDAMGISLSKLLSQIKDKDDATAVVTVITDGLENASREYRQGVVKNLIETRKKDGWEFLFIGANIDSIGEASKLGIDASRAANFECSEAGSARMFSAVGDLVSRARKSSKTMSESISEDWKKDI